MILAIDISTSNGSLALTDHHRLLEEFPLQSTAGYGEIVFAAMESLLRRHSVSIKDIQTFAVAQGPGTFTGVRMGLTLAQGLAEALDKPVCAVSNLAALAFLGEGPRRAPVLDARRGKYYTAVYSDTGDLLEPERLRTLDRFCPGVPLLYQTGPLAAAIAALAAKAEPQDRALLEPNYLRRTDAELNLTVRPPSSPRK